jgi:hypothetical protein
VENNSKTRINNISSRENYLVNKHNSMDSVSFKGLTYYGGRPYTDKEISDAKKYLSDYAAGSDWKSSLMSDQCDRMGFFEYVFTSALEKHVQKVARLLPELRKEELEVEASRVKKLNETALRKVKHEEEVHKIKKQLMTEFSDRIDIEQKGNKAKIPNAIMLIDGHDDLSKELVKWTGENSNCNFVQLANEDNETLQRKLWKTLNDAGETFVETKRRTLVSVEGFDRLITEGKNAFRNIENLKDIMTSCANDFGSTIIFRTKDASKLVEEAIQPQRVASKIMVAIKSFK